MSEPTERLLDVVTDLLVTQGWEGVSVRKVATAAGVSIGAVQHHFPTKEAMLAAAMERASEEFQRRLAERVPPEATAAEALAAVSEELIGDNDAGRPASVLWLVQAARAAVDPTTGARHAREWLQVEDLLVSLLAWSRPDQDEAWVREEAAALLALLDGLAVSQVCEPERMPAHRARELLTRALGRLQPPV